jgi:hypothetical protein
MFLPLYKIELKRHLRLRIPRKAAEILDIDFKVDYMLKCIFIVNPK